MNILYTNFHTKNGGGHTSYIIALAKSLATHHRVVIATPGGSELHDRAPGEAGVTVVPVDFKPRLRYLASSLWQLRRMICTGQFDVVHVNGSADHRQVMLATAFMLRRPAIVFTKHNDHRVNSVGNWLRAIFGTHHSIAVSDYVASFMKGSAYRALTVVKHGVSSQSGHHPDLGEQWRPLREARFAVSEAVDLPHIVLGSTAGTGLHKGWMTLALALASLPAHQRAHFSVLLAGELPSDATLAELAAMNVREQFHFTGHITDKNVVLGCSDVAFVLSHKETLSYACRESMSAGLPVLISSSGGLPENIDDGVEGWIVPSGDAVTVADTLRQMLADPARLRRMGEAARTRSIEQFAMQDFVERTQSVYAVAMAAVRWRWQWRMRAIRVRTKSSWPA
ncbi:glycosyltransferase family 4 protein [Robbsia sp. KACC 23696]|uniref:glycosyltransferase family 4 protein n=1 Tax=Robbsia sp. KACC 23696 TaxID=3149231 RepID=UPI00325B6F75